jgi:type II secretory pathway component PulM
MKAWAQLRPRDRRALTIGGWILVTAFVFSFGIQPYRRSRAELRERLVEQRGLLERELAVLETAHGIPAALENAAGELADRRALLLPGHDPLAATAALVGMVGEEARHEGVALEAIESRAAEPAGNGIVAVRIEVRGRADLEALLRWMRALETAQRLVRIDGLTVARSDAGAEPDSADTETLLLAAVIHGYVLQDKGVEP